MRILVILFLLFNSLQISYAASLDLSACRIGEIVELSYTASEDAIGVSRVNFWGSADIAGEVPDTFYEGTHHAFNVLLFESGEVTWSVEGVDVYASLTVSTESDLPDCEHGTGQPDGGIVEITAYVEGVPGEDVCTWEIRSGDGWEPIDGSTGIEIDPDTGVTFCRLPLGSDNLDHDPANYRASVMISANNFLND